MNAPSIPVSALTEQFSSAKPPLVIDVRRQPAFLESDTLLPGALRRDPAAVAAWASELPRSRPVVVYCVHGHAVSQGVASELARLGFDAHFLEGGIDAWIEAGGATDRKPRQSSTRWVTRQRPKIDRIACPWLILRFIDPGAQFHYVAADDVAAEAARLSAAPYDMPGAVFGHVGERCTFDALLRHFRLSDPALGRLATIVRGADTGRLDLAPQCAGLLAISVGLSRLFSDDQRMLAEGMRIYDALHAWCRDGGHEQL